MLGYKSCRHGEQLIEKNQKRSVTHNCQIPYESQNICALFIFYLFKYQSLSQIFKSELIFFVEHHLIQNYAAVKN
jgi:hypothetical protein